MDEADHAKLREMGFRDEALKRHRERAEADDAAKPLIIDGVVCCRDCQEPIEPERLRARPNAARCIDCKTIWERNH